MESTARQTSTSHMIASLATKTFGFLPCDLKVLAGQIAAFAREANGETWSTLPQVYQDKPRAMVRCAALPSYTIEPIPSVRWDDIGGLSAIKVP